MPLSSKTITRVAAQTAHPTPFRRAVEAAGLPLGDGAAGVEHAAGGRLHRPGHEKVRALVHRLLTGSRLSDEFAADQ